MSRKFSATLMLVALVFSCVAWLRGNTDFFAVWNSLAAAVFAWLWAQAGSGRNGE